MQVIGVLGGVASGKSFVTRCLAQFGAAVLDADRAGHEALDLPAVRQAARARWGEAIFDAEGRIVRPRLAKIVFAAPPDGPRERTYLEQLTHPEIGRRLSQQASDLAAAGKTVAVLDAALMLEAGWDNLCNHLIYVDAPREMRLARARQRGWTAEEFAAREAAQETLEQKRRRANFVVDNSSTEEQTRRQVSRFWRTIVG